MAATPFEITMPHTISAIAFPILSASLTTALQKMEQTEAEQGNAVALALSTAQPGEAL